MDPRIMKYVNDIKNAECLAEDKRKEEEALQAIRYKEFINNMVPQAEVWVDEVLIPEIARLMTKKNPQSYDRSISLDEYNHNKLNSGGIPVESKLIAIQNKKIEGIRVKQVWNAEEQNPNSESGSCMIPAHFSYEIIW